MARGDWWKQGVIYQIYPRSFADSNGDGIGDLPGILGRLDYLNDGTPNSLGIDAIWISPFYPSPLKDFGYDVSNYCDVHPDYGTLADFDALVRQAHARNMHVIVDFVPNHTSDRHPWFIEARSNRTNAKRAFYVWADPKPNGDRPNNWQSSFKRVGPAWTFDAKTGQSYLHGFLPEQPDLNWWNPEVRAAMDGVLRFWLDRGVDGFRIDVAHALVKDPKLRDNPPSSTTRRDRRYDVDQEEVHAIHRSFRNTLDAYGDKMAVGEVYLLDVKRVARYCADDELHLAFNFWFLRRPWDARAFRTAVAEWEALLPKRAWPNYTLSNHDHARTVTRYGKAADGTIDVALGRRRARVAAMMLLTLRGTPFLYYGEEIGMADVPIADSEALDIDGRDPERTPMQWDTTANAGFSTARPWLPVGAEAKMVNVAAQRSDPRSMLSLYRKLIWFRKSSAALRMGSYKSVPSPRDVFAYVRRMKEDQLLIALNFASAPRELRIERRRRGVVVLSTDVGRGEGESIALDPLSLGADEGVIVRL